MPANTTELEKRLWGAADEFRANSKLKSSEYSVPVLGLIFLRYADHKFTTAKAKFTSQGTGRRTIGKADYRTITDGGENGEFSCKAELEAYLRYKGVRESRIAEAVRYLDSA